MRKLDLAVKANFTDFPDFTYSSAVVGFPFLPGRISAPTSAGDSYSEFFHLNKATCVLSKKVVASQIIPSRTLTEINRVPIYDLQGLAPFRFYVGLRTSPDNSLSFRQHLQLHVGLSQHKIPLRSLGGG